MNFLASAPPDSFSSGAEDRANLIDWESILIVSPSIISVTLPIMHLVFPEQSCNEYED